MVYLKEDSKNVKVSVKEQGTQIQVSLMGQGEWQLLTGDWNISEILFQNTYTKGRILERL